VILRIASDDGESNLSFAGRYEVKPRESAVASRMDVEELAGSVIARASVADDGVLSVVFNSGFELDTYAADEFEGWELLGPRGIVAVALLGRGFAVW
jgi:hypothetical protein